MAEGIVVVDDPVRALADEFVRLTEELLHPLIALSGGSTPRQLFRQFAGEYRDRVPWERITLFQVDERCVPVNHPESNWRMIREELLDKAPVPAAYRMRADESTGDADYEMILSEQLPTNASGAPVFDLVLLGMGADGHTASLFPGTRAVDERKRFVVFNDVPQLKTRRLTLTFPVLESARECWFLVQGADKAAAFEKAQRGEVPAGKLRNAKWFLDRAAALTSD
jgi:6-phosphogluconolactonase